MVRQYTIVRLDASHMNPANCCARAESPFRGSTRKVLLGRRRDYGGAAVCRTPSGVRDWPARCQDRPTTCGTFKQSGEQVAITRNGSTRTVKINAAEGGKA